MSELRIKRVEELLRNEIGSLIVSGDIKDPRVTSFLSVTRVEAAKDFSFAKIFVSSFQDEAVMERGVEGLNAAAPFIQSVLGRKIRLRLTPRLHFFADPGIREGFEINKKLKDLLG
jgi:ribosome-binding factor A